MSNYWKKKMDELEEEQKKTTSQSYWERKTASFDKEWKTSEIVRNAHKDEEEEDDIAPIKKTSGSRNKGGGSISPTLDEFFTVSGNKDFNEKSSYISTKSDRFWDKLSSKYGMGYTDLQYEYINNQNGIRDEISQRAMSWGSDSGKTTSSYEEKALDFMTADEVAVYNYYYQTEGKDKAQEFLDVLAETLSARKAGKTFTNMEGKTAREILYGIPAGAEQFRQGVKSLGNMIVGKDDYIPQTSTQILGGMVREDLSDDGFKVLGNSAGQMAFDVLNTGANMAPSIVVGALNPVAGAALMGGSASGNAYQQVLNEGHDQKSAALYASIIGTLEGTLQYALGGIGKLGGTSAKLARAVSGIENGALRFALEYGGKIGSEAIEEGLQEVLDPLVKNAVLGTDEKVDWESVAYSALLGGIMGAGFGASEVSQNHLSNEEVSVMKKEVENRIAEAEADGTKLTAKEKAAIQAQVEKDLEKGYISTDLIEEVVGGDTFKTYKSYLDKETALQQEFDTLNKMKQGDMTGEQTDRRAALKEQLAAIKNRPLSQQTKMLLDQEVSEGIKGSRLMESYNERIRRGQAFEADLTRYDEKQKAVIQKAIDSGILNNTNRTHEFVDMVAKISADKGVLFDFTNNEKLKTSAFAVDGKAINGFVTKDGITINMQSAKALNTIVGHEITHVLEGTDLYTELQNVVVEYAKTKGDYQGRFDSLSKLYEAVEGADINAELTADLVGDYLFTDPDFIHNLSTNHRNVFQKIYDEVKYLLKVATAGSKEARQLEKVKRAFEKAYREGETARESEEISDSETKYSIREEAPPKNTGVAYKVFFVKDGKLYPPMVANPGGADTPMGVWLNADMGTAAPPSKTGRAQVKAGGKGTQGGGGSLAFRPGWHLGDLPRASQFDRVNPETGKKELFPENFVWAEVEYAKDVDYQEEAMSYGYTDNGKFRHAYAGLPRLPENGYYRYRTNPKPDTVPWVITGAMKVNRLLSDAEVNAILEKNGVPPVHRQGGDVGLDKFGFNDDGTVKYSLSAEQQEFFKDSVVRDESGNLKVMYHGTSSGGHTMFDPYGKARYGLFGAGSYFTDSREVAESYTRKGKGTSPQVYETYLNITSPMDMDAQADPAQWKKAFPEASLPASGTNEQFYRAMEEYFEDEQYPRWEAAEEAMMAIEDMGYDGITHIGGGRFNKADNTRHRVYIAFQPEQIKNVDNAKPTSDPDIRYSLSQDSDGNKLSEEQKEYFKDSKARDEQGRLIPVYHGTFSDFNIFDLSKTSPINDLGQGHYFTSNITDANANYANRDGGDVQTKIEDEAYGIFLEMGFTEDDLYDNDHVEDYNRAYDEAVKRFFSSPRVIKSYLNITNPLYVRNDGIYDVAGHKVFDDFDTEVKEWGENPKDLGYDGIIDYTVSEKFPMQKLPKETAHFVVFDSNQIKSVANKKPTGDPDIRYSLSDSNGKKLSAEQSKYFMDSKVRDKNGNLMVMYHGTPNGDFTVFKDGTYFTASKEYADRYQNPGASSISTGKVASNPKTFEVYLNIKKPFDISDAEARSIYINDYIKGGNAMGINPYLSDAEYAKIKTIDWTEGEDLREFLIENEYDYDGLVLDEGGTGGYGDEVQSRGKSYVVFSPEQVKNIDNLRPTADPDIRFSLSEAVEETRDLMAFHNLTEQKLLKSLKLGGLPMPSVAIAKAQDGHSEFGEISLVLPREAIDPQSSSRNKLYSGDAWTPTYPKVDYKPSRKVLQEVEDRIDGLVPYEVQHVLGSLMFDTDNVTNALDRYNGNMVEAYKNNDAMKYAYLKDTGSDISLPMKEADLIRYGTNSNAAVRYFAGKLVNGLQTVEHYRNMSARDTLQDKALTEAVADAQNFDVLRTLEPGSTEYLEYERNPVFRADEVSFRDVDNFLSAARKLFREGVQQTVDRKAAKELINETVDQAAYERWLEKLFDGVVEKEGIRNNKDYFTPSGNRRSFEALHYEHNLENVIKAMREKGEKGIGNGFGGASIFGASTTEFSSVEEMKQSSDRLQTMSYDEYQELRKGFTDRFLDIAMSLPNQRNSFSATDSAAEVLTEAVAKYKTRSGIANYLRRELKGWATYSEQAVDDLIELVRDIRKMPTGYFEAKPQRAVGFDEVGVFVIPNNADVKLKQELLNRGYSIAEYDPNVEGDRQRVVNQFEELKFSLSDAGRASKPYGRYNVYSKDVLLETAPVQEEAAPVPETESVAPVAISETPSEEAPVAPAAEESTPAVLYNKRDGKGGWGEVYGTAQEALNDAVQNVNRELYNAFIEEVDNTPQNTQLTRGSMPITNALIAVQEDVRQETITPIQGAQLLSEAYAQGGVDALKQMVNLRNGNLWDRYLEKAKQYETVAPVTENLFPNDLAPVETEIARLEDEKAALEVRLLGLGEAEDFGEEFTSLSAEWGELDARIKALQAQESEKFDSLTDADAPPEMEAPMHIEDAYPDSQNGNVEDPFAERDIVDVGNRKVKAYQYENPEVKPFFYDAALGLAYDVANSTHGERFYNDQVYYDSGGEKGWMGTKRSTSPDIANFKDTWKCTWDELAEAVNDIIEDNGKENNALSKRVEFLLNDRLLYGYTDFEGRPYPPSQEYIDFLKEKEITEYSKEAFDRFLATADQYAPPAEPEPIGPVPMAPTETVNYGPMKGQETYITTEDRLKNRHHQPGVEDIAPLFDATARKGVPEGQQAFMEDAGVPQTITRKQLHENIVNGIKASFAEKGFDFDKVLKKAKNLSTFATVDNTPQRVMEKALGYKEGGILSDITVNQVAQNETRGIQWLNSFTDRKKGLLAQLSKRYGIKPGSKESAAAQMYAEGFYVGKNEEIIKYGDAELAADFPNPVKQAQIKGLARDKSIRQIYDDTLKAINESRTRNAYPEIPRLDNYFLHFRAQTDTFSRLGIPFNPNDIRAKDLPTDLNGVTADLKPGQPFFASAMHREGKRTDFDLLGGLEQYLTSAKNQIYHIDDIQTLRALRNYVADTYGQANGLSDLDSLSEEEAQERIKEVYNSHLSTFAKFLNEEANVLAGKTALIDRGVEGIIGRRGITFLDTVNKQVGKNMVGFNVSSSMTNFLPVVQAFAKTNKFDFVKAMSQTATSKLKALVGMTDSFVENNPTIIRRKGAEKFYKLPYEKVSDAGYVLMSAVDSISTEVIVRAKYNELTRKGMSEQKAAFEADKWVSRLMGDRSLGQQPQLYNSKMLGLLTKFQLEVRNQLDSQFYDTIQEAKVSNEHIENGLLRNAKTAAKVGSTFFQLAVLQHVFGKAFESVAGYNPAFDIIDALVKAFGWDDDEESEDTVLDNIEQGFFTLLEDLPYTSTFTGGRIPISSALPIKEFVMGEDQYGNEKSRWETLAEVAPYYIAPGGYGQVKKTVAGLQMFSDDHPIAGSYTDSGNLRFPVEDTMGNRVQAALFGQWASGNARDYFDNERKALTPKQTQELIDVGISIQDYWKYREGLSGLSTLEQKLYYIDSLNLTTAQKNVLANNLTDRKEPIDMTDYDEFGSLAEFDYANDNPEKYAFFEKIGITYEQYKNADDDAKDAYDWAFKNPEKYTLSKAVASDVVEYRRYASELYNIRADKDENGKSISGSRKEKVLDYINGLDIDYGAKLILFKNEYNADDESNQAIIDYLNNREDISYEEMVTILNELGFTVTEDGTIYWD